MQGTLSQTVFQSTMPRRARAFRDFESSSRGSFMVPLFRQLIGAATFAGEFNS
jgi:hypothetical protein